MAWVSLIVQRNVWARSKCEMLSISYWLVRLKEPFVFKTCVSVVGRLEIRSRLHFHNSSVSVQSDLHPVRSLLHCLHSLLPSYLLRHLRLSNHLVCFSIYLFIECPRRTSMSASGLIGKRTKFIDFIPANASARGANIVLSTRSEWAQIHFHVGLGKKKRAMTWSVVTI